MSASIINPKNIRSVLFKKTCFVISIENKKRTTVSSKIMKSTLGKQEDKVDCHLN